MFCVPLLSEGLQDKEGRKGEFTQNFKIKPPFFTKVNNDLCNSAKSLISSIQGFLLYYYLRFCPKLLVWKN